MVYKTLGVNKEGHKATVEDRVTTPSMLGNSKTNLEVGSRQIR